MTTPSHVHRNARVVAVCAWRCTSPVHPFTWSGRLRLYLLTASTTATGTPFASTGMGAHPNPMVSEPLSRMAERRVTTGGEAVGESGGWDMVGGRVSGRAGGRVGDQAATGGHFGWQRPVGHTSLPPSPGAALVAPKKKFGGRGDRPTRPEKKSWRVVGQLGRRARSTWSRREDTDYTQPRTRGIEFGIEIESSLCLNLAIGNGREGGEGGGARRRVDPSRKKNSEVECPTSPSEKKVGDRPTDRAGEPADGQVTGQLGGHFG